MILSSVKRKSLLIWGHEYKDNNQYNNIGCFVLLSLNLGCHCPFALLHKLFLKGRTLSPPFGSRFPGMFSKLSTPLWFTLLRGPELSLEEKVSSLSSHWRLFKWKGVSKPSFLNCQHLKYTGQSQMDLNGHNLLESNVIISFNSQKVYCATLQHSCQWWQTVKNLYDPQQGSG